MPPWAAAAEPTPENDSGWAADIIEQFGPAGSAVAAALETFFPPVPSEGVLLLGGYLAGIGRMSFLSLILWSTVGSVASALLMYYIGWFLGPQRSRALLRRIPLMRDQDIDRGEAWFARRGRSAVLFGRMIPGVRSVISLPAGIERMPLMVFVTYTTIGSLAWNSLLIYLGHQAGRNWDRISGYVGLLTAVVVLTTIFLIVRFFVRRRREIKSASAGL